MTLDGSSAPWNRVISNLDKVFAMRLYPKDGIQRTTTDGVYFMNRERNGFEASGIAYYSRFGNNDGQQPDAYIEVSNGSFAWWENGGEGILLSFLPFLLVLPFTFSLCCKVHAIARLEILFWHPLIMNYPEVTTHIY
jgi:hypothetical protein